MNLKEAFKIRKKDAETDEVIITIGNHLATEQVFKSEEEAQKVIDATDWNLVAAMIYACKEADQWDWKKAAEALAENQFKDWAIGKANQLANRSITKHPYYRSPVGIGTGGWAQRSATGLPMVKMK